MHQGESHLHVFNASVLMPGETIADFAERHNIFVWGVLRLILSLL